MTIFYTHGWSQTGNDSRLDSLIDALLQRMDCNVILVDWGATSHVPYPQAVANTRIVSAQIARLCLHMIKKRGLSDFVEVLHTNGRPTLPLLGLGIFQPLGKYLLNHKLWWFSAMNIKQSNYLHLRVFCPHLRSLLYYIEALSNPDCTFWGVKRSQSVTLLNILSGGWLARYIVSLRGCDLETCTPVGLDTINYPARGRFDVATSNTPPYCSMYKYQLIILPFH
ncbi:hypothetical protein C0J52_09842 [Blattella germanica]|nr:hypothetical protein C0J52_09842 [Blattella germanica]